MRASERASDERGGGGAGARAHPWSHGAAARRQRRHHAAHAELLRAQSVTLRVTRRLRCAGAHSPGWDGGGGGAALVRAQGEGGGSASGAAPPQRGVRRQKGRACEWGGESRRPSLSPPFGAPPPLPTCTSCQGSVPGARLGHEGEETPAITCTQTRTHAGGGDGATRCLLHRGSAAGRGRGRPPGSACAGASGGASRGAPAADVAALAARRRRPRVRFFSKGSSEMRAGTLARPPTLQTPLAWAGRARRRWLARGRGAAMMHILRRFCFVRWMLTGSARHSR